MKGPIHEHKFFTVEEANQLIPVLTPVLKDLYTKKCEIENRQVQIDALELISGENTPKVRAELLERSSEFNELVNQFNEWAKKIENTGAILKDVDLGLVDFYGLHEGKTVFLCWKLGEPEVGFWHDVGSGYASRKPIL